MHELSVALSLLELIEQKCREQGCRSVSSVRVRVGKASGILPDAFAFAFDAAKPQTVAREAKFVIDIVALGGVCSSCGNQFTTEEPYVLECPCCSSTSFKINQGRELELVELEVD